MHINCCCISKHITQHDSFPYIDEMTIHRSGQVFKHRETNHSLITAILGIYAYKLKKHNTEVK